MTSHIDDYRRRSGATVTPTDAFRTAVAQHDLAALEELFTEDIVLHSPVKFVPFTGRPAVLGLFGVLLRTFEDLRYVGALDGTVETAAGEPADSAVLPFRATIDGRDIHGIDLLQFAPDGRIKEFTVMVRPLSAVQTLGAAVLKGLVEDGLAPAPDSAPAPSPS
ncbi:nuclear transport factor 2 family protein [Streptomyces sp. NPDC060194]|uniref:nuclear transport factor 2 family protein n=1 Tax=Streptomyces sp. NPDC060194 TaxID=3347069 RepID=UPI003663C791